MDDNACPQYKEWTGNGFCGVPNEVFEILGKLKISGRQSRISIIIMRLTFGWQKIEAAITNSQISEMTGIRVDNVTREISRLVKRKIIFVQPGTCQLIKWNTDCSQWQHDKDRAPKPKKAKPAVSSKMEKAATTNQSLVTTNQSLAVAKPKNKLKTARKATPEWFKEFWRIYPAHRRGGNHAFAWKKWQTSGSTEDNANKAKEWLMAAAEADPHWTHDATSGYAIGLARFINESHWLTPVPARKTLNGTNKKEPTFKDNGDKIKYCDENTERDTGLVNLLLHDEPEPF